MLGRTVVVNILIRRYMYLQTRYLPFFVVIAEAVVYVSVVFSLGTRKLLLATSCCGREFHKSQSKLIFIVLPCNFTVITV